MTPHIEEAASVWQLGAALPRLGRQMANDKLVWVPFLSSPLGPTEDINYGHFQEDWRGM